MYSETLSQFISELTPPPALGPHGPFPDNHVTNTVKLPPMEDLELFIVWNSDCLDFTESLIFKLNTNHTKEYVCSLRRSGAETLADLVKRTVEMALQKRDTISPPPSQIARAQSRMITFRNLLMRPLLAESLHMS